MKGLVVAVLALLVAAVPAAAGAEPEGQATFEDAPDDARRVEIDRELGVETVTVEAFPRAELLAASVAYGPTELAVSVTVAEGTDPLTDPAWQSDRTGVSWAFASRPETDLARVVRRVVFRESAGALAGFVVDATNRIVCTGTATRDGGTYRVGGMPVACVGLGGAPLWFAPQVVYDPADDGRAEVFYFDGLPERATIDDPAVAGPVELVARSRLRESGRLAGPSRFDTAAAVARVAYPGTATVAFLATAADFPDAVAAGSVTSGPVLLVPACGELPGVVGQELGRLAPAFVVALGGTAAVCDELLSGATALAGPQAVRSRLAGATRFETAVEVSRLQFPQGAAAVHLATAGDFPDALAAGTLEGGPILLVPACGDVPAAVLAEVARLVPRTVVPLGGDASVCPATADLVRQVAQDAATAADARGPDGAPAVVAVRRLGGPDRIATAVAISAHRFPSGALTAYLTTAAAFPDALAAGALRDGPILLVPPCGLLPRAVGEELARLNPTRVVALGGEEAVCPELLVEAVV